MTTTADTSKITSYAVLTENGPDASKIVSYAVLYSTQPFFQTDWPNPRGPQQGSITQRTWSVSANLGKDQFFGLAGNPTFDWPNPRGPQQGSITQRTWTDQYKLSLIGQDTIHGAPGQAPANLDWPVPKGPIPNSALRTWINQSTIQLLTVPVPPPNVQKNWPNPPGPLPGAITQGTWADQYKVNLVGADRFFGAPGQGPANLDWPVPKGAVPSIALRTWIAQSTTQLLAMGAPAPFFQTNWPNPRGRLSLPQQLYRDHPPSLASRPQVLVICG